jgi:hypothetical protein
MVRLEVDVDEPKSDDKKKRVNEAIERGLDETAGLVVRTMKTAHTPNSKTGETLRGIDVQSKGEGYREIGPATETPAIFLEKGTKPHIIMGNPYLAFTAKDGTDVVLGGFLSNGIRPGIVNHPGTMPNPFVEPGRRVASQMFPLIMKKEIMSSLKGA